MAEEKVERWFLLNIMELNGKLSLKLVDNSDLGKG